LGGKIQHVSIPDIKALIFAVRQSGGRVRIPEIPAQLGLDLLKEPIEFGGSPLGHDKHLAVRQVLHVPIYIELAGNPHGRVAKAHALDPAAKMRHPPFTRLAAAHRTLSSRPRQY
jgi:hypothetical protein